MFKYWIEEIDLDGFRIDTLKHVEPEFFEVFAPAMREHARSLGKNNFFMFGEAFDGKDFLLGSYTHGEGVDSVFYFSAKYQIFDDVFGRGAPTRRVQQLYQDRRADTQYGDGSMTRSRYSFEGKTNGLTTGLGEPLVPAKALVHFIDNHDVPRWLYSFKDALAPYRNAVSFLLTTDGIHASITALNKISQVDQTPVIAKTCGKANSKPTASHSDICKHSFESENPMRLFVEETLIFSWSQMNRPAVIRKSPMRVFSLSPEHTRARALSLS